MHGRGIELMMLTIKVKLFKVMLSAELKGGVGVSGCVLDGSVNANANANTNASAVKKTESEMKMKTVTAEAAAATLQ